MTPLLIVTVIVVVFVAWAAWIARGYNATRSRWGK